MHLYKVGELYHPAKTSWPECNQLLYRGECELQMFMRSPAAAEIAAAKEGVSQFALYDRDGLIVLLHRFMPARGHTTGIPWSESSFAYGLMQPGDRVPPPDPASLTPESRELLHLLLVDAATGVIRVLRTVSLSPEFGVRFFDALRSQLAAPFDRAAYMAAISDLYARYHSEQLVPLASIRCRGGD